MTVSVIDGFSVEVGWMLWVGVAVEGDVIRTGVSVMAGGKGVFTTLGGVEVRVDAGYCPTVGVGWLAVGAGWFTNGAGWLGLGVGVEMMGLSCDEGSSDELSHSNFKLLFFGFKPWPWFDDGLLLLLLF